jgi:hypothetical protein
MLAAYNFRATSEINLLFAKPVNELPYQYAAQIKTVTTEPDTFQSAQISVL